MIYSIKQAVPIVIIRTQSREREIQTLIEYVSAVLHDTELLRADAWERAATHWVNLSNDLPLACLGTSPNAIVRPSDFVDAQWQYRFAFGDLVC